MVHGTQGQPRQLVEAAITSQSIESKAAHRSTRRSLVARLGPALAVLVVAGSVGTLAAGGAPTLAAPRAQTTAAPVWAPQPTPPTATSSATLEGVSCAAPTACTAVGFAPDDTGTNVALAETWDGSAWTAVPTTDPSGATDTQLLAVSCPTVDVCTAVGESFGATGVGVPLAEAWNGGTWTIESAPAPTGSTDTSLSAVSCTTSTSCVAVGSANASAPATPLAESWNGLTWTMTSVPEPSGTTTMSLSGVSCVAAGSCTAVGSGTVSGTDVPVAATWNGVSWTVTSVPVPTGTSGSYLFAVSCASVLACTATGDSVTTGGVVTLAETWAGAAWTVEPSADPPGATYSELLGVACTAPGACTAVGFSGAGALAEAWDGASWTVQTAPVPAGAGYAHLLGVACPGPGTCVGVGVTENAAGLTVPLTETAAGAVWTLAAAGGTGSADGSGADLAALSCLAATWCTAVGSVGDDTLVEQWNGTAWSIVPSPDPAGATSSRLLGISCSTRSACVAVGDQDTTALPGESTLAEVWNGRTWLVVPTPALTSYSSLAGISCLSATACTAVGYDGILTLAEFWNGTSWTIESTPTPVSRFSQLLGISCTSAAACTAVGYSYVEGPYYTLAESWNGASWTLESSPNPAGSFDDHLSAVACTAPTTCVAVGYYEAASGTEYSLAETWDGTSWTVEATPNPSHLVSRLSGISCGGHTWCVAVGLSGPQPLAESLNGASWSIHPALTPTGTTDGSLDAVSCPQAPVCTAVGSVDTLGTEIPLAEQRTNPTTAPRATPAPAPAPVPKPVAARTVPPTGSPDHEREVPR